MKRVLSLLLALVLVLSLVACSNGGKETGKETVKETGTETGKETGKETGAEAGKMELDDNSLYLITDLGTIDDKSFNQGSFEGLEQFAKEAGVKANYLRPAGEGKQIYKQAIDQAIAAGAKIVVTPGYLFEEAVGQAQSEHPEIKFIAVDFEPKISKTEVKIAENTTAVLYKEEQSGFLAGYAAVKDGYTKLGFMGGVAVPAVIKFGFGFIAGANHAAEELGIKVEVKYNYTGSFEAKPEIQTMASSWFQEGTEVIFSCGGGIGSSVLKAAQDNKAVMIGVDVDQKDMGQEVITSAMKNLQGSVYLATKEAVEGQFKGGQAQVHGVETEGVQISEDFSRFKTFTKEQYDEIYKKLVDNVDSVTDNIPNDISNANPESFADKMGATTIKYIEN